MADEADIASEQTERLEEGNVNFIRRQAAEMPAGEPGECEKCGEYSPRLVGGACAPCRDLHGLP